MGRVDKATLRAALRGGRRARPAPDLDAARTAIRGHVLAHAAGWRSVAAYEPMRTEPGSASLLSALPGVIVPVLLRDNDLSWAADGVDLGLDAIASCDAVLVPALAVSAADGTRLGRGGGSYDRALGRVPAGVPIVALLFDGELLPEVPREPWDHPVTAVVTPSGWTDVPIAG